MESTQQTPKELLDNLAKLMMEFVANTDYGLLAEEFNTIIEHNYRDEEDKQIHLKEKSSGRESEVVNIAYAIERHTRSDQAEPDSYARVLQSTLQSLQNFLRILNRIEAQAGVSRRDHKAFTPLTKEEWDQKESEHYYDQMVQYNADQEKKGTDRFLDLPTPQLNISDEDYQLYLKTAKAQHSRQAQRDQWFIEAVNKASESPAYKAMQSYPRLLEAALQTQQKLEKQLQGQKADTQLKQLNELAEKRLPFLITSIQEMRDALSQKIADEKKSFFTLKPTDPARLQEMELLYQKLTGLPQTINPAVAYKTAINLIAQTSRSIRQSQYGKESKTADKLDDLLKKNYAQSFADITPYKSSSPITYKEMVETALNAANNIRTNYGAYGAGKEGSGVKEIITICSGEGNDQEKFTRIQKIADEELDKRTFLLRQPVSRPPETQDLFFFIKTENLAALKNLEVQTQQAKAPAMRLAPSSDEDDKL